MSSYYGFEFEENVFEKPLGVLYICGMTYIKIKHRVETLGDLVNLTKNELLEMTDSPAMTEEIERALRRYDLGLRENQSYPYDSDFDPPPHYPSISVDHLSFISPVPINSPDSLNESYSQMECRKISCSSMQSFSIQSISLASLNIHDVDDDVLINEVSDRVIRDSFGKPLKQCKIDLCFNKINSEQFDLNLHEFCTWAYQLNMGMSEREIEEAFDRIDEKQDGIIDLEEFTAAFIETAPDDLPFYDFLRGLLICTTYESWNCLEIRCWLEMNGLDNAAKRAERNGATGAILNNLTPEILDNITYRTICK